MTIGKYTSDKLRVMSFFAIIFVLYIHAQFHNYPNEIQGMAFNAALQYIMSNVIGGMAVPLFFMISGMLFFRNIGEVTVFSKIKKRVRTLLVPYLIAALFLPVVYLLMGQLPFTAQFVNGAGSFSQKFWQPLPEMLYSLFLSAPGIHSPWGFHLWFLRDLIIIVALSPILCFIKKRWSVALLTLLLATSIFLPEYSTISSAFWFMAGDYILPKLIDANDGSGITEHLP